MFKCGSVQALDGEIQSGDIQGDQPIDISSEESEPASRDKTPDPVQSQRDVEMESLSREATTPDGDGDSDGDDDAQEQASGPASSDAEFHRLTDAERLSAQASAQRNSCKRKWVDSTKKDDEYISRA